MDIKIKKPQFKIYFHINKSFYKYTPNVYFNKRLLWKDKYNSPRVEILPKLLLSFLWFQLDIIRGNDNDWEWWLWVTKYSDNDIEKAKASFPWGQSVNGVFFRSTPWINYNK